MRKGHKERAIDEEEEKNKQNKLTQSINFHNDQNKISKQIEEKSNTKNI